MKEISVNGKRVIIRKANKSDARALIEYLNVIAGESDFLTFGTGQIDISTEQEETFIENSLRKENALFIVAEINGKVVGNLNFSGGLTQRTAHIGELGVSILKEYWGNGIGRELIEYLISWSRNSKIIRKINLRVRTDNKRAINLYKKLGFSKEGIVKRDFLINEKFYDSLTMGLLID
ncbi:GNAT family N-acetyltransferase [Clostridium luticellarii]|jgi:RimJ/RimL family protein N-acetyltransferase|uniref:Spermidine N(1)-acetyltransferase n=1 Tax=Clostridium luticellarii TaxID=1691940 RepID=A0A2T0BQT8_9CLOT|nr:GNAT family protein [Clostridium luticellarii]MCI1945948.1 GNAT family N-acetyltransferase [Clostridium luticellarii]MCI1969310.1 GNAT family N-acetyltransferase [Clostridium luticellarii]MCI1996258.1 GNAT family N-acetyltransferase [Clostridium luticellarii]MCI2040598.1 GNAT family N-acetyltransferase [Clostridium luticellarii]PRR86243.1 Spermidine N(1)-acetyltransferase [Clostridium luticellarii]